MNFWSCSRPDAICVLLVGTKNVHQRDIQATHPLRRDVHLKEAKFCDDTWPEQQLARALEPHTTLKHALACHAILCLCRIGVWDCVIEIRQLLVGDTLLSLEYWRASYWEFLFSGFDCGTLDNLKEEPRLVLQDGSISSEALGGKRRGSRTVCVHDGEQKGKVLKTWYSVRRDAAHGLCSRVPSVAWLLRFGRAGEGKPHAQPRFSITQFCCADVWLRRSTGTGVWQADHTTDLSI